MNIPDIESLQHHASGLKGVTRIATIGDFPVETLVKTTALSVLHP